MDSYPESLAPEFEESGAVKTPFEEWWARVQASFPTVPENVARHWLHEHWSHSPYSWLQSRQYTFELVEWPGEDISQIQSRWCNFDPRNKDCREHGRYLLTDCLRLGYRTAKYMEEHRDFPAPIIVLDNHDGHLCVYAEEVPAWERDLPRGFILIEGHRRFNMALYLQAQGTLVPRPKVWLMRRA